jgi:hypothetical protein
MQGISSRKLESSAHRSLDLFNIRIAMALLHIGNIVEKASATSLQGPPGYYRCNYVDASAEEDQELQIVARSSVAFCCQW